MTAFSRRPSRVIALALASATSALACGASINAVYEGDVRFEHCMALEEHDDEKSSIQKGCWDEWVKYYTYGQTRDRVDYARKRQKQLSGESDFTEEPFTQPALAQRAVPEPTTVLAPPPMMIADAGKTPEPDASAQATVAPDPPASACASQCRDTWTPCKTACTTPACENKCAATYKRCMKRCY